MSSKLMRVLAYQGQVRGFFMDSKEMVQEAMDIHGLSPLATCALGRALTATAMMSMMLKGDKDAMTMQMNGKGPIEGLVVSSDSKYNIRGYVGNPKVNIPLNKEGKWDVGGAIGTDGELRIIRDVGLKQPYVGSVEIQSGEIAEDLAYYFGTSEQLPSIVALGVLIGEDNKVKSAGGYIIQLLPGASEEVIEYFEEKLKVIEPISKMLENGLELLDISDSLLLELTYKVVEEKDVSYKCTCTYERMFRKVLSIGAKDLKEIVSAKEDLEVVCHFCNKRYQIKVDEISQIINNSQKPFV